MAEFAYNNTKHTSTRYTLFDFNCGYHLRFFYKKDIDSYSESKAADELTKEIGKLMTAYRDNLQYAQKLQKQAYDKRTKLGHYTSGNKI